ncbi:TPA: hypothetical protein N0F65_009022 [Lagenidium giganteum]|uniref:Uncharacterized protein n=1 Tax=Lagenidium giganteum TaxID=4803 RepID=A0AAV2YST5_9STRA|nr:TPA: hypothetical protein N0F65_009022 [Lagenidium giganteum]
MDMNALIHRTSDATTLRAKPLQPSVSFAPTGLPGLRAHFPSLPAMHLPVFPSAGAAASVVRERGVGEASAAAPLAPLRFIIPSSHCKSTSNAFASGNHSDNMTGRATTTTLVKAEPEAEPRDARAFPSYNEKEALASHHHGSVDDARNVCVRETSTSEGFDDVTLKAKVKKPSQKRSRANKASSRSTKSKARPGLRKGKWSEEESRYAARLTEYFKEGVLPIERGTMLRLYLSQKLNCEPMRITKKFTGGECIGKQVFRPCSPTPESRVKIMQAQLELVALESAFIKRLKENKEEIPSTVDDGDSSSSEMSASNLSSSARTTSEDGSSDEDDDAASDASEPTSNPIHAANIFNARRNRQSVEGLGDDANAVGLLLDFFYKANRNEASSTTAEQSRVDLSSSPLRKRERTFSISNCMAEATKRPRLDSITMLTT